VALKVRTFSSDQYPKPSKTRIPSSTFQPLLNIDNQLTFSSLQVL